MLARVEPRWDDGFCLGVSDRSAELYVGTEKGTPKVRTLKRREATERGDLEFLNAVTARPWDGPKSAREPLRVVLPDASSLAVMAEADALGNALRLNNNKSDIMKYGLTDGCVGCRAMAEGQRAQGQLEGCRARLEAKAAKTGRWKSTLDNSSLERPGSRRREWSRGAVDHSSSTGEVQDAPIDAEAREQDPMDIGLSRNCSAEEAGHEADDTAYGDEQPDQGPLADARMHETVEVARVLDADAVALASKVSSTSWLLGWDLGLEADQVRAQERLSVEQPYLLILSAMCLAFSQLQALSTKPDTMAELLKHGRRHLEFACSLENSRLSEVDAFSLSTRGRRNRGTSRA